MLLNVIVKENKDEFLLYQKDTDRLEAFLWKFIGTATQFMNLLNVVKLVLILSHGQAQVERGFSTNRELLDQNMRGETLIAQRIVEDHMRGNNLQPQDLEMTHKLMEFVKNARKEYYLDQQKRSQNKIQNEKTKQKQALIDQIEEYSQTITVLKGTFLQLNSDADKYSFEAEKKTALLDINLHFLVQML